MLIKYHQKKALPISIKRYKDILDTVLHDVVVVSCTIIALKTEKGPSEEMVSPADAQVVKEEEKKKSVKVAILLKQKDLC